MRLNMSKIISLKATIKLVYFTQHSTVKARYKRGPHMLDLNKW